MIINVTAVMNYVGGSADSGDVLVTIIRWTGGRRWGRKEGGCGGGLGWRGGKRFAAAGVENDNRSTVTTTEADCFDSHRFQVQSSD